MEIQNKLAEKWYENESTSYLAPEYEEQSTVREIFDAVGGAIGIMVVMAIALALTLYLPL